jgi:transaldolase
MTNPLKRLEALGQSVWLDFISRDLIASGALRRLIEEDGLRGMTSNPALFEKAIAGSPDYREAVRALARQGRSAAEIYEALSQQDVRAAADEFRPVFERTDGGDGFVSLEVDPRLARDTVGTVREARRLWAALDRPNVFIKVPGTADGVPAIRQLVGEGINVNVTLLFGLPRYRQVAEAYVAGLEARAGLGLPVQRVASVASFFLSRIDAVVDPLLERRVAAGGAAADAARRARGQVAVASAKVAFAIFQEIFGGARFAPLAARGARAQRLLWASTGPKNPAYPDLKYVEPLIAPGTISTVPPATLDAYRDHGDPRVRLGDGVDEARRVLDALPGLGIDLDAVTQQLEDEGVRKFVEPFEKLLASLAGMRDG